MPRTKSADELKEALLKKKPDGSVDWSVGLSSGCTLLNLACSGHTNVCWLPGCYYDLVGDSGSGKTWLMHQTFAEACANEKYNDYRVILDQPEDGALMDVRHYFGASLAARLEQPPLGRPSRLLEEFYDQVDDAVKAGRPFIYGLDSEDALPPVADIAKMQEDKAARRKAIDKGKAAEDAAVSGSMGMGRAKLNSASLRVAHNALKPLGSILFVIKQTRDRVGFGSQFNPKTKSGGNAITFYATLELWFSVRGELKRSVKSKSRVVGSRLRVKVEKNRLTGRDRTVDLLFYPDYGFDDIGSMIYWNVEEGFWKGSFEGRGGELSEVETKEDFGYKGPYEDFVKMIEEDRALEGRLRTTTKDNWDFIEERLKTGRKPRYA